MTSLRRLAPALVLGFVAAACGGGGGDDAPTSVAPLDPSVLPTTVLGLDVEAEDLTEQLETTQRSYARSAGLFSLRRDEELQATLQVTEFDPDVDLGDRDVEGTILEQITKTSPLRLRMGEETVYMSRADRQSVAVWFTDRYFMVLSTRDSYEVPRALLRALTELEALT